MVFRIARAQKKMELQLMSVFRTFFNSTARTKASGKMSPRLGNKGNLRGKTHIRRTVIHITAPLFSTNFPYNSTQNGLEFLMGHHYYFDQFF